MHFTLGEFTTKILFPDERHLFTNITPPWLLISEENVWDNLLQLLPTIRQELSMLPVFRVKNEDLSNTQNSLNIIDAYSFQPHAGKSADLATNSNSATSLPLAIVLLPAGELAKTMHSFEFLLRMAFSLGLTRDSTFVVLGGGATSDVAAFASSVFMRGIKLIIVPTTLLAMVDASFGGKTGINYIGYKNMIGTIYPASELRVHHGLLRSLPQREYLSGITEVIKVAMLDDIELIKLLESYHSKILARDVDCLNNIIHRSLSVKGKFVNADLRESGIRTFLNLGHTFAHALEVVSNFNWSHGEAVAWGIMRALVLGELLHKTDTAYRERIEALLQLYGYQLKAGGFSPDQLLTSMKQDKKRKGATLCFVLQRCHGETFLSDVADEHVLQTLQDGLMPA